VLGCLAHPQRSAHPDEPFGTCSEWVNKDVRECQTLSQVCICVFAEHTKMLPTLEVGWEGQGRAWGLPQYVRTPSKSSVCHLSYCLSVNYAK